MQKYVDFFEKNPTKKVFFQSLKKPWINKISREEALWIGKQYWNATSGDSIDCFPNVDAPDSVYVIVITRAGSGFQNEIWVDKTTGEIVSADYTQGK